tara:strand:- start:387 stop:2201 length:1815 start_codon:yes stop_codon:yes gene_type:complete
MSSIIERLTEGVVNRDMRAEGHALLSKWERTGLLEGLETEVSRKNMARLLENQAKELLRESSSMAGGDVEGFAAVAFPIVRRVFAGLIANDLVAVQPMSLPSGLIFFLDFTVDGNRPSPAKPGYAADSSFYGGGVVGSQLTGGISLSGDNAEAGPYGLNNGYASPTGSAQLAGTSFVLVASGCVGNGGAATGGTDGLSAADQAVLDSLCSYDPDLSGSMVCVVEQTGSAHLEQLNVQDLTTLALLDTTATTTVVRNNAKIIRRLSRLSSGSVSNDPSTAQYKITLVYAQKSGSVAFDVGGANSLLAAVTGNHKHQVSFQIDDDFQASTALGSVVGDATWGLENQVDIPEINIKVDSIAVTAMTKKLKAKWTPELGQDLNAYHNLDAEVELTSILSEQIALEIDREILEDLVVGATAGTLYWSRSPGLFVNRETGQEIGASSAAPDFTGTVSEWYETLIETINDVSARIHRKTLRGGANFLVCSPEVANILEFTSGFRASVTADDERGSAGAVRVGAISKKFDVYVDPYFLRNVILVGRRGTSFLESGYVYAPYVPLQTTPTIFGPEDFVPRKGVMTRYAKKMVRPDLYGLVICRGLIGEAGATS